MLLAWLLAIATVIPPGIIAYFNHPQLACVWLTGGTTVNVGTLMIGIANAINSASAVTVASGATVDLSTVNVSDTSSSWCVRGVMSRLTPMFSYWNDVMGCCGVPPVAIGAKVVTGIGTRSPN